MNDKFSFDKVGKRMPYSVPDDLFAKMEDNILEEIKGETPKPLGITKKKRPVMRRLIPFALTARFTTARQHAGRGASFHKALDERPGLSA